MRSLPCFSAARIASLSLLGLMLTTVTAAHAQRITAPGFKSELLLQVPDVEHPSSVTCDDQGNLFIGEDPMDMRGPTTKEFDRILFVRFDSQDGSMKKTVFAENLSAVFGLLWHDGWLYVLHAPHYSRFKDNDGDGVADVREDLADGFGPTAGIFGFNDHIVTGIRMGMDGWVYISVGDKGIQKATGSDGSTLTLEGGGVVRMQPDGSRLEIVTSGTRNHLDVAMDSQDNIFTYDNTDDGLGWWTRLTHHVPTGYYGYPFDYHPHPDRHLPRISEHGGGSPCGACCYRGAVWPEKYRDAAFFCEWGKGKVQCFHFTPSGSTFTAEIEDFMVPDGSGEFRPVDACVSPDGKYMYVADWNFGGWTRPDVVGRVYRVSYVGTDVAAEPARSSDKAPMDDQLRSLGHPSFSERIRAQHRLAAMGQDAVKPLMNLLADRDAVPAAKTHAIWALAEIAKANSSVDFVVSVEAATTDADPQVRAQVARALGELGSAECVQPLLRLLADANPTVRMRAAIALGRCGSPEAGPALARSVDDPDLFARFCKIQAIRKLGVWNDVLSALHEATTPEMRDALLLAATAQYDRGAVEVLNSWANTAPDSAGKAKAIELLSEVELKADPYVTGWWGTRPAAQGPARPKIHSWDATDIVAKAIEKALGSDDADLRIAAIRSYQDRPADQVIPRIRQLAQSDQNKTVREEAFAALANHKDKESIPILAAASRDARADDEVRVKAVESLVELGSLDGASDSVAKTLSELTQASGTSDAVASLALRGLTKFPSASARQAIEERLNDRRPAIRSDAVSAYAAVAGNDAVQRIASMATDPDSVVRQTVVRQLGQFADRSTMPVLLKAVNDSDVYQDAIIALSSMPDKQALSAYLAGLTDRNQQVRNASQQALIAIREEVADQIGELAQRGELSDRTKNALFIVYAAPRPLSQWHIVGSWGKPIQPKFDPSVAPDLTGTLPSGDHMLSWKPIPLATAAGRVDPGTVVQPTNDCWALAYTTFRAPASGKYIFQIGSDDEAVVWIDGEKVLETDQSRAWSEDQNRVDKTLAAGDHVIYFMTGNQSGPWSFSIRVISSVPATGFLMTAGSGKPDPAAYAEHARKNPGRPERGKALFEDTKGVGCVKCHAVGGKGRILAGPDLLGVGAKYPKEELIRSVLEPSNRILSGYEMTVVLTADGEVVQGVIKSDTADKIELVDANGKIVTIAAEDVDEKRKSDVSMMPNGLADGMSPEDFADIISYLETLR